MADINHNYYYCSVSDLEIPLVSGVTNPGSGRPPLEAVAEGRTFVAASLLDMKVVSTPSAQAEMVDHDLRRRESYMRIMRGSCTR